MIKTLTIITIFVFLNFFLSPKILAQENISIKQMVRVSPIIIKINLSPSTTQNYKIKIENLLDTPLPLRASIEGFDASDEEYGITTNQYTTSPLINWIILSEKDAILPAKTARDFNLQVAIPDKIPMGGYYAMIFFTPIFPGVPVDSKIGVLALANIGIQEEKNNGEIATFNFSKKVYEKNPIQTSIRVKNTSFNYFTAKPFLTIRPLFGSVNNEKTYELEEKTILPGKIRRWQKNFDLENPYGGICTAKLAVSLEKGDFIYRQNYFICFPVRKAILLIFLALLVMYILVERKKVFKALKILVRG